MRIACLLAALFAGAAQAQLYEASGSAGAPSVASCGTSPSLGSGSTDMVGSITVGTGVVTACTLNFSATLQAAPKCTITSNSVAIIVGATAITTSALSLGFGASLPGGVIYYFCPIK